MSYYAAVDLGASSGRVIVGHLSSGQVELHEVHRFPNTPVRIGGTLHWDVLALYRGVLEGLRAAHRAHGELSGIGIDSWAVDYGMLDRDGALLSNPVHYRDTRTDAIGSRVDSLIDPAELYSITGLARLPFNTVYQLAAEKGTARFASAEQMLLIPDLFAYWLTGRRHAESTNASTTALYDVRSGDWSWELIDRLELPRRLFAPILRPGAVIGPVLLEVAADIGAHHDLPVFAVGSHDTASAVVGVPAQGRNFAYISCGTWSLVGLELDEPVLSPESRAANFTNETGVDGTIRYLRNVMGLWLLQECIRTWNEAGLPASLPDLLQAAAAEPGRTAVVDPDHPSFLAPGDMPARIITRCLDTGQEPPQTQGAIVRCILDSLALAYKRAIDDAVRLSGRTVDAVHIVGGGMRNDLLCRLTAHACGLPVVAGPAEAATFGNVLVQARARGEIAPDAGLQDLRDVIRRSTRPLTYSGRPRDIGSLATPLP